MQFSTLDYGLIIALAIALIYGGMKGLLHFLTIALAVITAFLLVPVLHPVALKQFSFYTNTILWKIVLFLILLVVINIVLQIISHFAEAVLNALVMGWLNHVLGAVFMFVLGCFVIYFAALLLQMVMHIEYAKIESRILHLIIDLGNAYIGVPSK
ncbi:MAG: CvpA family protein [Spirochaetes bacterium]|nr:CvpA family protein [Spirochaetota bacterium]